MGADFTRTLLITNESRRIDQLIVQYILAADNQWEHTRIITNKSGPIDSQIVKISNKESNRLRLSIQYALYLLSWLYEYL
jgi:hypothetical protein